MKYFTHLTHDGDITFDADGKEFADLQAARSEAMRTAGDIVAQELWKGNETVSFRIFVSDAFGQHFLRLEVNASVHLTREG